MNTKFLFIPSWIMESIKASHGIESQILDHGYIKNILSSNDLSELVYFSENASRIFNLENINYGKDAVPSSNLVASILNLWTSLGKGAQPSNSDVEKIRAYIAVNDCERSLNERLFTTQPHCTIEKTFEIVHFDMGVIGVVIHPGAFTPGQSDENRFVLIRTLVLELTRLNPQEAVASTLLMRRYIELLNAR